MADIDTRSDIYSLGVLLYEMLIGKTPFESQELLRSGLEEMRRTLQEKEPPRPSTRLATLAGEELTTTAKRRSVDTAKLLRQVQGDLDWVVMKCLEKDRSRRYETANGLAADLMRHLASEPVMACPPSAAYRLRKAFRRNKLAFSAAAAVAVALAMGVAVSTWQAVRATRAEKLAQERLRQVVAERDAKQQALQDANAISTFLMEVFQSPDPSRDGRTITVAESLDKAAQKLENGLVGQTERKARLEIPLGNTYMSLGLPRQAIPLLEKARDNFLATLGPENPDTLAAMNDLADALDDAGHYDQALELLQEVLPLSRKVNGPESSVTLKVMGNLAFSMEKAGRRDEALKLQEQVLALSRRINGPEHPDTLSAMGNLANFLQDAGRLSEALKLREEVLPLSRKVNGPEHPATLSAMGNLANSMEKAGRVNEALKLREEVLPLSREINGPEHPDTLQAMHNLANSLEEENGRRTEAIKLFEEVLPLSRRVNGPEHPVTLAVMADFALCLDHVGRREEALKLQREALDLSRKVNGPEHPSTLNDLANLAGFFAEGGRWDEAIKLQQEVLALSRKVNGPDSPATLGAMENLGALLKATGREGEALKLMQELVPLARKVYGPKHPMTLTAMSLLGVLYYGAGRPDDGLAMDAALLAAKPGDTVSAMRLAALQVWFGKETEYAATCEGMIAWATTNGSTPSDFERVAKLASLRARAGPEIRSAVLTLARRAVDLGHTNLDLLPWLQMALGMAEYRNGNFPAAEQTLKQATVAALSMTKESWRKVQCISGFYCAMSLKGEGKTDEARTLFSQTEANMKPLPADKNNPLAGGADHDDLIGWMAYNEAKAMLKAPSAAQP